LLYIDYNTIRVVRREIGFDNRDRIRSYSKDFNKQQQKTQWANWAQKNTPQALLPNNLGRKNKQSLGKKKEHRIYTPKKHPNA